MTNKIPRSLSRKVSVGVALIFNCICLNGQQSISEIKLLPPGSVVTTTGIITTGPEFGQIRYMQDTEAGIALYSSTLLERIQGDSIIVTGVLSTYQGQLQLSPVLSHQLISSNVKLPLALEVDLSDPQITSFESMRVIFPCIGISTCESIFDADWYTIFDHNGIPVRMNLPEDHSLIGQNIPAVGISAGGIWTMQNEINLLLCDSIQEALSNCHVTDAGKVTYDNAGFATLTWKVTGNGIYHIEYGVMNYDSIDFAFSNEGEVQYTFEDSLDNNIYKARLYQNILGNEMYSLPVYFSPKTESPFTYELFFNRNVDITYSDGSLASGVGATVIASDVIERIDDVDSTLDIAMYNTTSDQLVSAIKRAAQRGVRVRYIADDETSNSSLQGVMQFQVMYRSGDGIMHHKFMIGDVDSDHAWLWTGSTNFSTNQLSSDPNHAYVFHHKALAKNYKLEFEELWGGDNGHGDAKAGEYKSDNTCHQFLIDDTYIESYFSPSDETNCHIVDALRSADHHLEIGLLLLTKENLVDELIELHQNGIDIRLIVEDQESSSLALSRLHQAGVPTAIHEFSPIFHHKYAIIDEGFPDSDPMVVTGSHNWTYSADNINDENTLIIHDQSFANIFRQEFEARWEELITSSVESPSDSYEIILHPNPADDFIEVTNPKNAKCDIILLDIHGAILSRDLLTPHQTFKINTDKKLPDGLYLLHWKWNDGFATSRVVIQNK